MIRTKWVWIGMALGAVAGGLWGWLGSGGYEAADSAVGTGLILACAGMTAGVVVDAIRYMRRRRSSRRYEEP
jgi:ABC-type uncharacterized transport system permease subunit